MKLRNCILTGAFIALAISAEAIDYNLVLGCPSGTSIVVNVLSDTAMDFYLEHGDQTGVYTAQTTTHSATADTPSVIAIASLQADTRYYYRMQYKESGQPSFVAGEEYSFHTQRVPGSTFTFCLQGDSHPERGSQFNSTMYTTSLHRVAVDQPDFYLTMGDDFSVDTIPTNSINQALVTARYTLQRPWLGLVGSSAPLFLVNGNHEQAAQYLLDGTSNNIAVWAQNARNKYYPQPAPDGFYTGNTNEVEYIGLLRNYFAWTWGDALFVTIDPYWGSPTCPDNNYWTGVKRTNMWDVTHGEAQYQWLKKTLEESTAKYKFVFAHHVMGTGRGGAELADAYEWGGNNKNGTWGFDTERPRWDLPIHQLMVSNNVTIFFQGHDHIFARQELDGVVYQTLSEPGDPNYALINDDAFDSIAEFPNTGYTRVTVSSNEVQVDYVRTYLPGDGTNGEVAYSYTIPESGITNSSPVIMSVTNSPAPPVAGSPTWITAHVTDDVSVAEVTLHYNTGDAAAESSLLFHETMRSAPAKPWTGDGCDYAWTVAYSGTKVPFEQNNKANYDITGGNTNGLAFKGTVATTNLADNTITLVNPIDARSESAYLEFYLQGLFEINDMSFALQLDSGSGFVTRTGAVFTASQAYQLYHYDLQPSELVSNLMMRFQFQSDPAAVNNRMYLDEISITGDSAGSTWTNVTMVDDGAHGDGAAGDGIYGAQIPAQADGTTVSYYITATDGDGGTVSSPAEGESAPATLVVGGSTPPPPAAYNMLLGRPTDSSVTLNAILDAAVEAYVEYGTSPGIYSGSTTPSTFAADEPVEISLTGLWPDTKYYYRLRHRASGDTGLYDTGNEYSFRTQRAKGSVFTFDIHADPHLDSLIADEPDAHATYSNCIQNTIGDAPDFVIDLGDISMCESNKLASIFGRAVTSADIVGRHLLTRSYFDQMCHSIPLFLCQGNHDGEQGWMLEGAGSWPTLVAEQRLKYFPNPYPDGFYNGNEVVDPLTGIREDYYAWEWGDVLFVVMDPFWTSTEHSSGWDMTIGDAQYQWFKQTLENSDAKFKFVFCHHLVGGTWLRANDVGVNVGKSRGGADYAKYYEWGGYTENTNGTPVWEFDTYRPTWEMPIHDLMVSNKVSAFFHGHDHFYGKEERDGIIYQECPQPFGSKYTLNMDTIAEYGYNTTNSESVFIPGCGHLRVTVSNDQAQVDYVRAYHTNDVSKGYINGQVSDSYIISAAADTNEVIVTGQPNVVFIFADDLGWGDVGYHGSVIETPNIDSLATGGVQLDRYYSYPICGPSRVGLMTGRNPYRLDRAGNISESPADVEAQGLDLGEHLLPETFKAAGYQTFGFGKWHLGGYHTNGIAFQPQNRGFDHYYGFMRGSTDPYTHTFKIDSTSYLDWWRNGVLVPEDDSMYCTDLLTDEAVSMIQNHNKNKPFMLYLAFHVVHTPLREPPDVAMEKYLADVGGDTNRAILSSMADNMDINVGKVLQALQDEGIYSNTVVAFVSDNGGAVTDGGASNGPLRGEKGDVWDGGIRVPAVISWPGVLPAGGVCTQLISVLDWLPTLAAGAGIKPQNIRPLDGADKWETIKSNADIGDYSFIAARSDSAVISGEWKLVTEKNGPTTLYNIYTDPYETNDLSSVNVSKVIELQLLLDELINPDFKITQALLDADGELVLTWNSDPANIYDVERSTNLVSNDWTVISSNVTPNNRASDTTEVIPNITNFPSFFRIREQ